MLMRNIFTPKHQRLVNQCYPTGRTTDKKPKSSETSYLLFYVNSRRSKLEKVSGYLKKRTSGDLGSRRRAGNVSVTLELMDKIVNNCKENLNVFIKDFFTIMVNILSSGSVNNDVAIVELVEQVFSSICSNIDGALYNGDVDFIQYFSSFIDQFLRIIKTVLKNDELLLKWCVDISRVTQLSSNPKLNHYVGEAVSISLLKFQERYPRYSKPNLLDSETADADQLLNKRLTRTQTRMQGLDNIKDPEFSADTSVQALQLFFNTTETEKLNIALRVLLTCLQKTPNKDLLEFICNGVPVQLRYIIILILVRQLSAEEKGTDPIICLKLMSSLLTSDVSIVGLSVLDILRKIIEYQLKHITNAAIVRQTRHTLRDVEFKTYYKGQTSDVIYDIVGRLNALDNGHEDNNSDNNKKPSHADAKRAELISDIKEILGFKKEQCITVELFIELVPYLDSFIVSVYKLVDKQIPGVYIFGRLFQSIRTLTDKPLQKNLMHVTFKKYQKYALFSGLKYFYEETEGTPDYAYYCYHIEAATFIGLSDYANQAEYKYKNNVLFSKEDLLNYYSDDGSNEYSQRGTQILLAKSANASTSDLLSDTQVSTMPVAVPEKQFVALSNSQTEKLQVLKQRMDRSRQGTINNGSTAFANTDNIYRYASEETRSLKSMRRKAPNVNELKNVMRRKSQKGKSDGARTNTSPMRGSQSVKSRVTNITFLLSELKSTDTGNEANRIRDIDEDDIVGLDKIDIARAQSSRLSRNGSSLSTENRRSFLLKKMFNDKQNDLTEKPEAVDDEFQDATEDVNGMDTRGMLFSAN